MEQGPSGVCDPMGCSLPGSSAHGILQARVLDWVAISFSRGSSQPKDRAQVSMRVARGSASWLSSHGRGLGPRDALKKLRQTYLLVLEGLLQR